MAGSTSERAQCTTAHMVPTSPQVHLNYISSHPFPPDEENRFLALPYLVLHILLLAYTLGVTVFFISTWNGFAYEFIFLGFIIISWLLSIYFIVIVYSYYESLRDQSEPAADYCPPMPMVQVAGGPPQYPKYP